MKFFLILLFATCLFGQSIQQRHISVIKKRGTAAPPSGQNYSDDFNRSNADPPSGDWTELYGSAWEIWNNELLSVPDEAAIAYDLDCDGVTQYVCVQLRNVSGGGGGCFRSSGTGSDGYYVVFYNGTQWLWEGGTDSGLLETIGTSATPDPDDDDYVGITIQGTGNQTVVKIWDLGASPSNFTPYDKDNWDSASDAADATISDNPSTAYDTGLRVGCGGYADTQTYDNWYGGDCP